CASQRLGADCQRDRHQPRLSHHRCRRGRGCLRLPRPWPVAGRFGTKAGHSRRPGMHAGVCRRLYPAQRAVRRPVHPVQSAIDAPEMTAQTETKNATASPQPAAVERRVRPSVWRDIAGAPLSAKLGMAVIVFYVAVAVFAPVLAPYGETDIVGKQFEEWSSEFILGTD